ncbi:DUF393 domain-containing protein [Halobacillus sp. ACCC02827]|uniref:thiol-disulfide oxidoreductase DCC family protein n=1 Tax=Bacillaceae TaxID=186817 RepID=UPI0002A4EA3B|nr:MULTISPECIES: DUF393 domain-containing protein [Bacillaceae]ELK46369.1 hypothetical protein D479_11116 [Halobacillus sp. BAB-2008]QHT48328.1 DUF393 domain-containing protein [Bacillus sp. SB49]WJE15565.1 DUF393 domain-containing protein [Halobacillus sp. ACCC02827]
MKHIVFYDAQCPFCFYVKKTFRAFDWQNRIKWVSVQETEKTDRYPYLEGRPVLEEIHMLTKEGEIVQGFHTIRKLLLALPLFSVFGILLSLPGMSTIGSPLYRFVSDHRHQWFGRYDIPRYE